MDHICEPTSRSVEFKYSVSRRGEMTEKRNHKFRLLLDDAESVLRHLAREATGATIHRANNMASPVKGFLSLVDRERACRNDCVENCKGEGSKRCTRPDRDELATAIIKARIWIFRYGKMRNLPYLRR